MLPGQAAVKDDWETAIKEAVDEGPGKAVGIDISGKSGIIIDEGAEDTVGVESKSLDDYINNPKKFGETTPGQLYKRLKDNGLNPLPLSGGNTKGISFEQGGGFKVNWGGDRILQYHPAGRNHHGGSAYFKISSGPTGTLHFDLFGNPLPPIRTK